jgi:uncharacterized membrane protein
MDGITWPRTLSFLSGLGMIIASALSIQHFFAANYPESIFEGSFCDINAFFNCDSSAYSRVSQLWGVPLGYPGLVVGALVSLGALFPSARFERTNKSLAGWNALGVILLFLYSVLWLGSLCLFCTGYYVFAILSFLLLWRYGVEREGGILNRWAKPDLKHLAVSGVFLFTGAWGIAEYHEVRMEAQSEGTAARIVEQFYSLERVEWPSFISPLWTARSTERFEDAPIRVVEYADLLCPDCLFLTDQLDRLKEEFAGKINIAFQMFPLEARCNDVVEKDLHPGACDLSYMAAHDPGKFNAIHDDIFANFREAKSSAEWRAELSRRWGVEGAVEDPDTKAVVQRMIATGREYEKTSDRYAHGIRSTPTMIVNNRMIIGTLPYEQLRAIFQALVDETEGARGFLESWVEPG